VLHERVVLATVKVEDIPHVPVERRVVVRGLTKEFFCLSIRYGFKDDLDVPAALQLASKYGLEFEMMQTSFFLGRDTLIPTLRAGMPLWMERLYVALFRNETSATAFFNIPTNRVVELGTQIEI
jgi:KUP system potassium uptake protein